MLTFSLKFYVSPTEFVTHTVFVAFNSTVNVYTTKINRFTKKYVHKNKNIAINTPNYYFFQILHYMTVYFSVFKSVFSLEKYTIFFKIRKFALHLRVH